MRKDDMNKNPRYRVITDTREIARLLRSTHQTIFNIEDFNLMATVTNLGMLGEDLMELGHPAIANFVNNAGKLLFTHKGIGPITNDTRIEVLRNVAKAIILTDAISQ
jgi:hypothetical protein